MNSEDPTYQKILNLKIPSHPNTTFDEDHFLKLLAGSYSLLFEEKKNIVSQIPEFSQEKIDRLIEILEREKEKFEELEEEDIEEEDIMVRSKEIQDKLKGNFPIVIKLKLDMYIVSQDYAKENLAVAFYEHLLRITTGEKKLQKGNVLLIGPTGVGKTYLIKTLSNLLNFPIVTGDASSFVASGYVGQHLYNCLTRLLMTSKGDIEKAQKGIVYIDEADKMAKKPGASYDSVGGEELQHEFLRIIEGTTTPIPVDLKPNAEKIEFNTEQLLFVFGGSFDGITDIVRERVSPGKIGFISESPLKIDVDKEYELLKYITPEDLIKYGIIPELVGRIPIVAPLKALDENDMYRILVKVKDSLVSKYTRYFELNEDELIFEEPALRKIAQYAIKEKMGARSLVTIMEKVLYKYKFISPNFKKETFVITAEYVDKVMKHK